MPSQHREALTVLWSTQSSKFLTGLEFLEKDAINLQFVQGVKGGDKLKIHLSSFYRMAKDVVDYYQRSGNMLPNLLGRDETRLVSRFQMAFYQMIRHVVLTDAEKEAINKKITDIQGSASAQDSPINSMIQMMSGMFNQLGLQQPGANGASSSSAPPMNPLSMLQGLKLPNQSDLMSTVKNVVENPDTKSLVEEIGSDIGASDNFSSALGKVFQKVQDPNFVGKVMNSFGGIMNQLQGLIPPQPSGAPQLTIGEESHATAHVGDVPVPEGSQDVFF